MSHRDTHARYSAIVIAVVTAIILSVRVVLSSQEYGSVLLGVSYLSQFFTILTNAFVLIAMIAIGFGYKLRQDILGSLVVAIAGVGVLYHLLLAHLWSPQGLAMLADQGVDTVVPLLTFLWWLVFSDIGIMSWVDALKVIVWPLIYVAYVLLRAQWSNFYPYPFLNLVELGSTSLIYNIIGLAFVFYILGLMLLFVARCIVYFK